MDYAKEKTRKYLSNAKQQPLAVVASASADVAEESLLVDMDEEAAGDSGTAKCAAADKVAAHNTVCCTL